MKTLLYLIYEEKGQGLVEYSLIISLIVLVAIGAVQTFGVSVKKIYVEDIVNKWP